MHTERTLYLRWCFNVSNKAPFYLRYVVAAVKTGIITSLSQPQRYLALRDVVTAVKTGIITGLSQPQRYLAPTNSSLPQFVKTCEDIAKLWSLTKVCWKPLDSVWYYRLHIFKSAHYLKSTEPYFKTLRSIVFHVIGAKHDDLIFWKVLFKGTLYKARAT